MTLAAERDRIASAHPADLQAVIRRARIAHEPSPELERAISEGSLLCLLDDSERPRLPAPTPLEMAQAEHMREIAEYWSPANIEARTL